MSRGRASSGEPLLRRAKTDVEPPSISAISTSSGRAPHVRHPSHVSRRPIHLRSVNTIGSSLRADGLVLADRAGPVPRRDRRFRLGPARSRAGFTLDPASDRRGTRDSPRDVRPSCLPGRWGSDPRAFRLSRLARAARAPVPHRQGRASCRTVRSVNSADGGSAWAVSKERRRASTRSEGRVAYSWNSPRSSASVAPGRDGFFLEATTRNDWLRPSRNHK